MTQEEVEKGVTFILCGGAAAAGIWTGGAAAMTAALLGGSSCAWSAYLAFRD